jgi:HTH-type transcriptional regulator/antitoxin HigA
MTVRLLPTVRCFLGPNGSIYKLRGRDLLARVIEDDERKHWPIDPPDPVDAIRDRMETGNFSQPDPGRLLGSRQHASDILVRRPWTPADYGQAWKLLQDCGIPVEALIRAAARVHRAAAE